MNPSSIFENKSKAQNENILAEIYCDVYNICNGKIHYWSIKQAKTFLGHIKENPNVIHFDEVYYGWYSIEDFVKEYINMLDIATTFSADKIPIDKLICFVEEFLSVIKIDSSENLQLSKYCNILENYKPSLKKIENEFNEKAMNFGLNINHGGIWNVAMRLFFDPKVQEDDD